MTHSFVIGRSAAGTDDAVAILEAASGSQQAAARHLRTCSGVAVGESVEVAQLPAVQLPAVQLPDPVEDEGVQYVRAHLKPDDRSAADAQTASRFIRATNGNLPLAVKRLEATIHWRRKHCPDAIVCTACAKNPHSHYMHPIGFDKAARPIIYSCNGMATDKSFKQNEAHMISCFEHTIKLMAPGVEQWVWVMDFHGFGFADINVRLAKAFLDVSADHYPERLGLFLIVDAPRLFNTLWTAIEGWIDPKTRNKIRFLSYDAKPSSALVQEMAQHFSAGTTQWLLTEMAQNREKRAPKVKAHCQAQLYKRAASGALAAAAAGAPPHEHHGTPELLRLYCANPRLLMPQAGTPAS